MAGHMHAHTRVHATAKPRRNTCVFTLSGFDSCLLVGDLVYHPVTHPSLLPVCEDLCLCLTRRCEVMLERVSLAPVESVYANTHTCVSARGASTPICEFSAAVVWANVYV